MLNLANDFMVKVFIHWIPICYTILCRALNVEYVLIQHWWVLMYFADMKIRCDVFKHKTPTWRGHESLLQPRTVTSVLELWIQMPGTGLQTTTSIGHITQNIVSWRRKKNIQVYKSHWTLNRIVLGNVFYKPWDQEQTFYSERQVIIITAL